MTGALPSGVRGRLVLAASDYRRNRVPWLRARREGIGASEVAALYGLHPYQTEFDVWAEKITTLEPVDSPPNEAAEWGGVLEDVVARRAVKRHRHLGRLLPNPGLLAHEDHPQVLATLDRLLVARGSIPEQVVAGMEVKTVSRHGYDKTWRASREHPERDTWPPPHIQLQVQQQLAVSGLSLIWVVALVGGQHMPEPFPIHRDEVVIADLTKRVTEWWDVHVRGGKAPEVFLEDADNLSRIWPGDDRLPPRVADDDVKDHVARYREARRLRAQADDILKSSAFRIEKHLDDATELVDEDGNLLATWRPQSRRSLDIGAIRKHFPDVAAQTERTSQTRVFRVTQEDDA